MVLAALTVLLSWDINMASEPPTKKVKTSSHATVPAVSDGGVHFTPELFARMATFADANNSPDVMNICLAAGPAVSRTIKHFYLSRNEKYLIDTLKKFYRLDSSAPNPLDRLRPCVAVFGTPCWRERVVSYEDI